MLTPAERQQCVEALLEANKTKVQTTRPSALFPEIEFDDAYAISAEVAILFYTYVALLYKSVL